MYIILGAKYERWYTYYKTDPRSPIDVQKSILIYIPPQIYESIGNKKLHCPSFADF